MVKVLLVDDSKTIRFAVRCFLEQILGEGAIIDEATDGTEAVDYMKREQSPDLVLTDMHMLRMNGIKAAEEMRSLGYNGLIIIQSSDYNMIEYLKSHGNQTIEYLAKGDLEALQRAITTHLKLVQV